MDEGSARDLTSPSIRAIQTQNLLRLLEKLPPEEMLAFEQRIDHEIVGRCRAYRSMAWVPMAEHMHLCVALREVTGRERFIDLFRETFQASMRNPLLRGLFRLINTMSSDSVTMLFKNSLRIYGYVTRDVGVLRYERLEERDAVLVLSEYPPDHDMPCWVDGTHGSIMGAMQGVGAGDETSVVVEELDEVSGKAVYRLRW